MTYSMYAIKDELNGYTSPIPFISKELAKRYFKDQYMNNPTLHNNPKDFSLWYMGEFDTTNGKYTMTPESLTLIERAENYGS